MADIRVHPVARIGVALVLFAALGWGIWRWQRGTPGAGGAAGTGPESTYVGSTTCAECHAPESAAWRASQHAAAMAEATGATVKGRFENTSFDYAGTASTFSRQGDGYLVRTDGPDGRVTDFPLKYTFGVAPLQQYLIEQPGGRLQALGIAWDTRPAQAGGQRWFHLYPGQNVRAGNPLHWSGVDQNWNYMCADCHSTHVRKGYDQTTHAFTTTTSEISVGCEACHGPGSAHVAWAKRAGASPGAGDRYLTANLDERKGVTWRIDTATGVPLRSQPRVDTREIQVCARCHSRRSQVTDLVKAGDRFEDGFRAGLLEPALFFADGQQQDEVYTHASFLQSKMYAKGVTCSDCHDPHSGTLRQPGNAVCTQCHAAPKYDAAAHTLHAAGTPAASCATCHMPARTYMQVDARHDHSFRVPRPDRTLSLGVPNACTSACHQDKSPSWAEAEIERRTGHPPAGFQTFAEAFRRADLGLPGAAAGLRAILDDPAQPAIVRASVFGRMAADGSLLDVQAASRALRDADPTVRRAAVGALRPTDEATRMTLVPQLLDDPVRTVRIEAAVCLADVPEARLPPAFARAFDEYLAEQRFNADRADAQTALGTVLAARREFDAAVAALREAIRLDASFVPAYVNLADVLRTHGGEEAAERVLRDGLSKNPDSAEVHHALGLALVRQHRTGDGLVELAAAVRLAPQNVRYAYVQGVALHDTGKTAEAIAVLTKTIATSPFDPGVLAALGEYHLEAGHIDLARGYTQRLLALNPGDPGAQTLASRLR